MVSVALAETDRVSVKLTLALVVPAETDPAVLVALLVPAVLAA